MAAAGSRASTPLTMSVNLSARQLQHPGLVDDVEAALDDSGFPAPLLTLELTESVLMQGGDSAIDALHALKALGVRLALDDFGTGYSSLSYLRNLPVDVVKIDRSFIEGIDAGAGRALRPARRSSSSGTRSVSCSSRRASSAPAQAEALRELGCPLGQGFHFWRPLAPDAVGGAPP